MTMKTPGVYIVEQDAFPNSVAQVATAIPAFIGHTERAMQGRTSLEGKPFRITSLAEFIQFFGGPPTPIYAIEQHLPPCGPSPLSAAGAGRAPDLPEATFEMSGKQGRETLALIQSNPAYILYASMRLFFDNGGGACYVTSVGSYADEVNSSRFLTAITALKEVPEPSLIVIPETTRLPRQEALMVQQAILTHCGRDTGSRFGILDISGGHLAQDSQQGDPIAAFRQDIGVNELGFGAAYYPWLNTTLFSPRDFTFQNIARASRGRLIALLRAGAEAALASEVNRIDTPELSGDFIVHVTPGQEVVLTEGHVTAQDGTSAADELRYEVVDSAQMAGQVVTTGTGSERRAFTQAELAAGKVSFRHDAQAGTIGTFGITVTGKNGSTSLARCVFVLTGAAKPEVSARIDAEALAVAQQAAKIDKALRGALPLYRQIMETLAARENTLPPGAAMAGLYAMTDASRGVWKAPANVSVNSVNSVSVPIDDDQQEGLNVALTGKSVNAIRAFPGRGVLVWGARTLDGNSADWRYINVRRTMIMIEQSLRLACAAYVFEPNTQNTWVTMRSMIENFLTELWKVGALAGATPEQAFSVQIGLGQTMTATDILEGTLKVTVMVAITRPAEFIVLTLEQQMQES